MDREVDDAGPGDRRRGQRTSSRRCAGGLRDAWDLVMLQSTGAAIQDMLLAATDLGIGSLWICDVLYARCEVLEWLGHPDDTLVAAVTLGYVSGEVPGPRPRRPWQEVTEWPAAE